MLIRLAIDEMPAPVVVVGRTGLAALVLWIIIRAQGGETRAALRDILKVLRRRAPNASVLIRPARVQGEDAAADVATSRSGAGALTAWQIGVSASAAAMVTVVRRRWPTAPTLAERQPGVATLGTPASAEG